MTDWIVLPNRMGKRRAPDARVTMTWRHDRKGQNAYIIISKTLRETLAWPDPTKVQVAHDPAHTMLRIAPAAIGRASSTRHGGTTMYLALPWVQSPPRPAAICEHRTEGDALIITLPDWARPSDATPAAPPAPKAEPAPAPKPAPQPATTPAETPRAPAAFPPPVVMSIERDALFRRIWLDASYSLPAIQAAINELPGRTIPMGSLYGIAKRLGLGPRTAAIAERSGQPADGRSKPGPKPRDAVPDLGDPLARLPLLDRNQAKTMLASNRHGASDLARHFGWEERDAIRIAAALRDEIEAEAAERRRQARSAAA